MQLHFTHTIVLWYNYNIITIRLNAEHVSCYTVKTTYVHVSYSLITFPHGPLYSRSTDEIWPRQCKSEWFWISCHILQALRLSSAAKRQSTVGQIVNLMSVDAQKVQDFFLYTTLLWSVPLLIGLATYFLWMELGPSCMAGFAVLCVLVPLNALYFARKAMKLQVS